MGSYLVQSLLYRPLYTAINHVFLFLQASKLKINKFGLGAINKLVINLACLSRTGELQSLVIFIQTSLHLLICTVTTSGKYSPVQPSCLVNTKLLFFCGHLFLVRGFKDNSTASCLSLFCNFTCDNFGLSMFYGVKFCLWNSFSVQCRTQFFWWVKIMLQTKRIKIMVIEILILYMTIGQPYHQHDITLCYHHLNPFLPNISRHILHTVLYTFLNSVSAAPSNYRVRTKFHHKPFHSQDFRINSPYILHTFLKM